MNPKTGEIGEAQIFVAALGASNFTCRGDLDAEPSRLDGESRADVRRWCEQGPGAGQFTLRCDASVSLRSRHQPHVPRTRRSLRHEYCPLVLANHVTRLRLRPRFRSSRDGSWRRCGTTRSSAWPSTARSGVSWMRSTIVQKLEGTVRGRGPAGTRAAARDPLRVRGVAGVNIDYHVRRGAPLQRSTSARSPEGRSALHRRDRRNLPRRPTYRRRSYRKGAFTTDASHRPKAHTEHLEWTPSRIIRWAEKSGPHTAAVVRQVLEDRPHPEHGYRACLGIMRLGKRYSTERLEAACHRALGIRGVSYRTIASILKNGRPTAR